MRLDVDADPPQERDLEPELSRYERMAGVDELLEQLRAVDCRLLLTGPP
ncbi:hypothetical protein [Streptosporangium saharense]